MAYNPLADLQVQEPLQYLQSKNNPLVKQNPLNKTFGKTENVETKQPTFSQTNVPQTTTTANLPQPDGLMPMPTVTPPQKFQPTVDTQHGYQFPNLNVGLSRVSSQLPEVTKEQVDQTKSNNETSNLQEVPNPFEGTNINPKDAYVGEYNGSTEGLKEVDNPFEQKPKEDVTPLSTIKDIGKNWWDEVKNVWEEQKKDSAAYNKGEISQDSHLIQTIGNVSNALVGAPIKAVFNSFVDNVVPEQTKQEGTKAVADFLQNTEAGQRVTDVINAAKDFSEKHPEAADDIAAVFDTAMNLVGGKVGTQVAKEGVEQAGETVVKQGEKAIANIAEKRAAKGIVQGDEKLREAIQPKYTVKAVEDTAGKGTRKGLFQKRVVERTPADEDALKVAREAGIVDGKDMDQNYNKALSSIESKAKALEEKAATNGQQYNRNNMKNIVLNLEPAEGLTTDGEAMFKKVKDSLIRKLDAEDNDSLGALKAVKKRRQTIRDQYPNFYDTDKWGPLQQDVFKINKATNDRIDTLLEGGAKESFKEQAILYDLADVFKSKIEKPGTNILDRNPLLKQVTDQIVKHPIQSALGGLGGAAIIKSITK